MTRRRYGMQRTGLGQWVDRDTYAAGSWQQRRDFLQVTSLAALGLRAICVGPLTEEERRAGEFTHTACDRPGLENLLPLGHLVRREGIEPPTR